MWTMDSATTQTYSVLYTHALAPWADYIDALPQLFVYEMIVIIALEFTRSWKTNVFVRVKIGTE